VCGGGRWASGRVGGVAAGVSAVVWLFWHISFVIFLKVFYCVSVGAGRLLCARFVSLFFPRAGVAVV